MYVYICVQYSVCACETKVGRGFFFSLFPARLELTLSPFFFFSNSGDLPIIPHLFNQNNIVYVIGRPAQISPNLNLNRERKNKIKVLYLLLSCIIILYIYIMRT